MSDTSTQQPQRLFTALGLADHLLQPLLQLRPPAHPAVNRSSAAQMHLTLCFIGPGFVEEVDELLRTIHAPRLRLQVAGLGKFSSSSGSSVLWAGVDPDPSLLELQARLAQQLRPLLHKPDTRRYRPHVTLARCKPRTPQTLIEDFLEREGPADLSCEANSFGLYSSLSEDTGAHYTCEKSYPLNE